MARKLEKQESDQVIWQMYKHKRQELWECAVEILADEMAAEDVLQTVFTKLAKHGIIVGSEEEQFAYVRRAVKNQAKDVLRAAKREARCLLRLPRRCCWEKDPESYVLLRERIREMIEWAAELPLNDQWLAHMCVDELLTYEEISERLGVSKAVIYVKMNRLHERMKRIRDMHNR